jgi:tetraacyldisaccharide 4'-kinase
LSALYGGVVKLRKDLYQKGYLHKWHSPVPVVVVGNITAGGSGKTPLVSWLAKHLLEQGYHPGIVSRGYRAQQTQWPQLVTPDSDPYQNGDEPVLLAQQTGCPVSVGPDRPAAARALLQAHPCDLIITDDGLQHYALARDIEIAVIGPQGLGNRLLIPAGPLREPPSRLDSVDLIIHNGPSETGYQMTWTEPTLAPLHPTHEQTTQPAQPLKQYSGQRVHAIAGIAYPARFYDLLQAHGLELETHSYPDHHQYTQADLSYREALPILMTSKDAVKCRRYAIPNAWVVQLAAQPDPAFIQALNQQLTALCSTKNC